MKEVALLATVLEGAVQELETVAVRAGVSLSPALLSSLHSRLEAVTHQMGAAAKNAFAADYVERNTADDDRGINPKQATPIIGLSPSEISRFVEREPGALGEWRHGRRLILSEKACRAYVKKQQLKARRAQK